MRTPLPAAHYFTKMADERMRLLPKNSTTTGCFLLTRHPIAVFTIFAAQLTTAMVIHLQNSTTHISRYTIARSGVGDRNGIRIAYLK